MYIHRLMNRKTELNSQTAREPHNPEPQAVQAVTPALVPTLHVSPVWPQLVVGLLLCGAWLAVVLQAAAELPTMAASWLTFLGLLIAPGFLAGDLLVRRLSLDWLERLALAFPLGVAVLAVPGMVALLLHWRVEDLAQLWMWFTLGLVVVWLLSWLRRVRGTVQRGLPWGWDERLLLGLIALACVVMLPVLNQHKIDGDTLAVGSFTADAMAGLPLNQVEPLFGTDLGPGVRMAFNQSLPVIYLWSYWSGIDPMLLMGSATRAMFAFWALLATYMLGKAAGVGMGGSADGRRVGLLAVAIQVIIYLAAPFLRGDNVSLFFFERIAADKFLVPVTMLPVAFGLAIRYVRLGEWRIWWVSALVAFAVSAIHPLVAAMLALGLGAFGAVHVLTRLRVRAAWQRVGGLAAVVVIVMALPLAQLMLARGEDPLAASYPASLEGWQVSHRWIPVLPYLYLPTLDIHGPLPDLSQLEADEVLTATDPFLVWRFAVNMDRRRLVLFDRDRYISDPNIFMEPPYLLALLVLPLLAWRLRASLGVQFVVATTGGILFVMYNPLITPVLGGLVMPWILWRFVWMFPYAIILALGLVQLLTRLSALTAGIDPRQMAASAQGSGRPSPALNRARLGQRYAPLAVVLVVAVLAVPAIQRNFQNLSERAGFPYFFPQPQSLLQRLGYETEMHGPGTVMADADLSVTIPAYVAQAHIVAHRVPTTSEIFPAHRQTEALQRLIDQEAFYGSRYLTVEAVEILERYATRYVVTTGGSNLDIQLRLLPGWFVPLFADQSYVLYEVGPIAAQAGIVQANTALAQRRWSEAELLFRAELARDEARSAAWVGLAEIAHARGEFDEAVAYLEAARQAARERVAEGGAADAMSAHTGELAAVEFRLGQLLGDLGRLSESIEAYAAAAELAPTAARLHIAHGDACLRLGQASCAAAAFETGVAQQNLPDAAAYTVTLADIWRQRGHLDEAIVLYEQAAGRSGAAWREDAGADDFVGWSAIRDLWAGDAWSNGSRIHQLILVGAYQEAGRYAEAEALLEILAAAEPFSPDVWSLRADLHAAQGEVDEALAAYSRAIRLLDLTGRESTTTRLAMVSTLLQPSTTTARAQEVQTQLDWILHLEPANALAYSLLGDLHTRLFRANEARQAYENAFRLDPTSVAVYFALNNQYRRLGGAQSDVAELLQAALRANPNESTLALALGDQLQRRGDLPGAVEAYLAALDLFERRTATGRLNPRITGGSRAYAYVQLAGVHQELGQMDRSMNFYSAAVASAPDAAWAHVAYGDALRRRGHMEAATAAYRSALRVDSGFIPGYLGLADLLIAQGSTAEAEELRNSALAIALDQLAGGQALSSAEFAVLDISAGTTGLDGGLAGGAEQTFTSDVTEAGLGGGVVDRALVRMATADMRMHLEEGSTTLNLLGRLAQNATQVDVLFQLYSDALAQGEREGWYPTAMAQYHKGMGDLYLLRNRPEAAVESYATALALDEGWLQARLGLVNALNAAGRASEAAAGLETLLDAEPGIPQAQIALARQYAQGGESARAIELLESTIAAAPGNVQAQIALGQIHQEAGEWVAAERLYMQAISLVPGAVDAYTAYANLLLAQGRLPAVEEVLHAAHALNQNNFTVHLLFSTLAQRQGDGDAAADWLARAATLADPGGANLVAIADLYGRFGLNQDGLRFLDAATAAHPDQLELVLRRARTLRTLGQHGDALAALLAAANRDLTDARLTAELAEVYLAQGRRETAVVTYRQATVLDPLQENYWLRLAELLTLQGDNDQAERVLQQGMARVDEPASLYTALSELYLRLGRTDEARELLRRGLDGSLAGDTTLLVGMGVLLEAQSLRSLGAGDSAEQWYQDALTQVGDRPELHAALADHYLRRSHLDRSLSHYETAIALAPDRARYYLGMGVVQRAAGNPDGAAASFQQAIRLEPGLLDAYYQLIELYNSQRMWDEARAVFVTAKQVAPGNGELHVRYAGFLLERGDTELGMQLLNNAARIAPNARTLTARAAIYYRLRRTDTALIDLQQAIAWEPGNVDAHIALGDVLRDLGNHQAASQAYGNAIRLNPSLGFGRLNNARLR